MIDAEKVREYIVSLMVIQKQTKEKLPEIETQIKLLEEKKKLIEEKIQKEKPAVTLQTDLTQQNQPNNSENQPIQNTQPVIHPELLEVENELSKLNSKRAEFLADIDDAQMEIEKAKASLTRPGNTNERAEELLANLQGAVGKIDDVILKKKTREMELTEELKKLKEDQQKKA